MEFPEVGLCQAAVAVLAGCLGVMTVADSLPSSSWEVGSLGWWLGGGNSRRDIQRREQSTGVLDSQK